VKALCIDGRRRAAGAAAALALGAPCAHAHLVETGLGPVYDGIAHFALTPEDLIPALAVAVLGALVGAVAGIPALASLPWLPLIVSGGLVAADLRLPGVATTAIAAAIGMFLGLANGVAMAQAGAGVRGAIGITCAVFVVTTLCAASAVAWQRGWQRIAWRAAGSWIAASGLLLLGWSLR